MSLAANACFSFLFKEQRVSHHEVGSSFRKQKRLASLDSRQVKITASNPSVLVCLRWSGRLMANGRML